jgi:hypothetical protein
MYVYNFINIRCMMMIWSSDDNFISNLKLGGSPKTGNYQHVPNYLSRGAFNKCIFSLKTFPRVFRENPDFGDFLSKGYQKHENRVLSSYDSGTLGDTPPGFLISGYLIMRFPDFRNFGISGFPGMIVFIITSSCMTWSSLHNYINYNL